jgi:hypothetical protein
MPFSMEKEKVRETEPDDQLFDDALKASPIGVALETWKGGHCL